MLDGARLTDWTHVSLRYWPWHRSAVRIPGRSGSLPRVAMRSSPRHREPHEPLLETRHRALYHRILSTKESEHRSGHHLDRQVSQLVRVELHSYCGFHWPPPGIGGGPHLLGGGGSSS